MDEGSEASRITPGKAANTENYDQSPKETLTWGWRKRAMQFAATVGVLGGALAFLPTSVSVSDTLIGFFSSIGEQSLPGSFPSERWRDASQKDYAWLADTWCFPTLPDFTSEYRINDGVLERRNRGVRPEPFLTDWIPTTVHRSNKGTLRLQYPRETEWSVTFISHDLEATAEHREHERSVAPDGSTLAGKQRLVLSCSRCRLSNDGFTYSCDH